MRWWLVLAVLVAACSEAPPQESLPERPTIVSLNPCADAILADIGSPGQLLAVSHYSHDPDATSMSLEAALAYPATGGTAEEVMARSPLVVVADPFLAPATRRALERAGYLIETVGIAGSPKDSLAQVERLGEVTGNEEAAAVLSREITASWEQYRWDGPQVSAVVWQEGGLVAGEGSLVNAMLEHTGFSSLPAARGMGQGAYLPLEQVLANPPQVVITAGGGRMLDHPLLREGSGVQHFELEPSLLYCGGPTIPRALERLMEIRRSVRQ